MSGNIKEAGIEINLNHEVNLKRAELISLRRDFHQHPELSFQEVRTSKIVSAHLKANGLKVIENIGKTGVVGILEGSLPGKTVLWRADMDALPVQENNTKFSFHSEETGVMHACGHDAHTAIGLVVADILAQYQKQLPGRVIFIFQPAEEVAGGAKAMLEDGLFEKNGPLGGKPDFALGLHVGSVIPAGVARIKAGPLMASVDTLHVKIQGKGGHAATPDLAIDPVVIACQIVVALQTLVSREVPPTSPAVLTFGSLRAGTKDNIIPNEAILLGTLRTFEPEIRQNLLSRIEEMITGLAKAFRANATLTITESLPAVINNSEITKLVEKSAVKAIGAENVEEAEAVMGSEDMSIFMEQVPGCFINIGAARPGETVVPHHSPDFAIDEISLEVGVKVAIQSILDLLLPD